MPGGGDPLFQSGARSSGWNRFGRGCRGCRGYPRIAPCGAMAPRRWPSQKSL